MAMRMKGALTPSPRQEIHRALWSTYLRVAKEVEGGPQSLSSALQDLCFLWPEVPSALPVVGTALWDVLRYYQRKAPPEPFVTLLDEVLGLQISRARELRREPQHADFPPFQRPMIGNSSFSVSPQGTRATLTVLVEASFDKLSVLADPEEWPRLCPLFWASVRRNGNGWDAEWRAPAMGGTEPRNVRLVEQTPRVVNPTETTAEIRLLPEGSFGQARLLFDMRPEPQKPGWTRITHKREVAFAGVVPQPYRKGTTAYWTKSEIACLVLQ